MANEHNLIPAKKGEIRNPKGKPKGVPNTKTRLKRLLLLMSEMKNPVTGEIEGFTVAEQMDLAMISQARGGNVRAYNAILDRLEGRPVGAEPTGNINFNQFILNQRDRYNLDG